MSDLIPGSIDEVTPEWLGNLLGSEVKSFDVTFLEGGVLSDAFKIHDVDYADKATDKPSSFVIKLTNAVADRRAVAMQNKAYLKEVKFFKELADEVPIRTPEVYALLDDGSEAYEHFCILMEDLTTHSLVFDQVTDPPDEAWTRKINLEAAEMHAKFWDSDTLKCDWLSYPDNTWRHSMQDTALGCPDAIGTFVDLWEKAFDESPFQDEWSSLKPLTDLITSDACPAILDAINRQYTSRPWTLVHNDLRADNMFRTRDSTPETGHLTYIDWQLLAPGPVGPEFTQSWQHSLPPELRRKDLDFLKQYHDQLVHLEPRAAEYTYDMLVEDYRAGFILWWMALITLGSATFPIFFEPEGERMKALWGQGLGYMKQAIHDHNCLEVAENLLANK